MYLLTEAELEAYLWVQLDTNIAESIISQIESFVHNYCNVPTFEVKTWVEERFEFDNLWPYFVRYPNARNLTEINSEAFSWSYRFRGRILEFADTEQLYADSTWDDITFKYDVWYASDSDELEEIKQAALLVWQNLYRNSNAVPWWTSWVKKYTIWDISEEYGDANSNSTTNWEAEGWDLFKAKQLLNKYRFSDVIA